MNRPSDILPRFDLREPAFRRYESFIAKACKGSYELRPTEFDEPRSARTFCMRFRDAVLAFKRYGYFSDAIPKGYNIDNIRALETTRGTVLLENLAADSVKATSFGELAFSDMPRILSALKVFDDFPFDPSRPKLIPRPDRFNVSFSTPEEKAALTELKYSHPVLVYDSTSSPSAMTFVYYPSA